MSQIFSTSPPPLSNQLLNMAVANASLPAVHSLEASTVPMLSSTSTLCILGLNRIVRHLSLNEVMDKATSCHNTTLSPYGVIGGTFQ